MDHVFLSHDKRYSVCIIVTNNLNVFILTQHFIFKNRKSIEFNDPESPSEAVDLILSTQCTAEQDSIEIASSNTPLQHTLELISHLCITFPELQRRWHMTTRCAALQHFFLFLLENRASGIFHRWSLISMTTPTPPIFPDHMMIMMSYRILTTIIVGLTMPIFPDPIRLRNDLEIFHHRIAARSPENFDSTSTIMPFGSFRARDCHSQKATQISNFAISV
jgi:hypothetical protein